MTLWPWQKSTVPAWLFLYSTKNYCLPCSCQTYDSPYTGSQSIYQGIYRRCHHRVSVGVSGHSGGKCFCALMWWNWRLCPDTPLSGHPRPHTYSTAYGGSYAPTRTQALLYNLLPLAERFNEGILQISAILRVTSAQVWDKSIRLALGNDVMKSIMFFHSVEHWLASSFRTSGLHVNTSCSSWNQTLGGSGSETN